MIREMEARLEGMAFAFYLVKLIFGCAPHTVYDVQSLMSTDEFPGWWDHARHLDLMADTWVDAWTLPGPASIDRANTRGCKLQVSCVLLYSQSLHECLPLRYPVLLNQSEGTCQKRRLMEKQSKARGHTSFAVWLCLIEVGWHRMWETVTWRKKCNRHGRQVLTSKSLSFFRPDMHPDSH